MRCSVFFSSCGLVALSLSACRSTKTTAKGGGAPAGTEGASSAGASAGSTSGDSPPPAALGAVVDTDTVHFRVRADAATAVEVDVYAAAHGVDEVAHYAMTRTAAGLPWAVDVAVADLTALGVTTIYYGYRAWGPNWPQDPAWVKGTSAGFVSDVDTQGNRYNPNKLLIDPYTREISHDPEQPFALSGAPYRTGSGNRTTDNGRLAPKSIAFAADTQATGTAPTRALKDDVIYEVHVRGLTMNDASIPAAQQGTYAGAALKAQALAALGVTAIELLPVQETQNDQNDANIGGQNYWGYSTLAFFAPDRRYAADKTPGGPTRELAAMVAAFHAAGIKVFLDVVYNHTAEGGASGSAATLYSFRGLDNAGYYELSDDKQSSFDNSGVGGNFGTGTVLVQNLVLDSLSYWKNVMGVDGFRFDLAAVLANSCIHGCFQFYPQSPTGILARAVAELPARPAAGGSGVDLIAEPWGIGNGTYQQGAFPNGWSEWNGAFRDQIRTAQNELGVVDETPSTLFARLTGSPDLFNHNGRTPAASINFVDCHDGFTLHDEYAYSAPDNDQAYPLGPSDGGSSSNNSWDQTGDAGRQRQAARTALALVALSSGVPMIQGGDEMLRTQYGNNNAYNLDDDKMWLDWSLAASNADFVTWTRALFAFRAAHPGLRPPRFFDGADHNANGLSDLTWFDTNGDAPSPAYLANSGNHFLSWRIDCSEAADTVRSILIMWNGWSGSLSVTVPPAAGGYSWWVVGDSHSGAFATAGQETAFSGSTMTIPSRTVWVMVER